MGNPSQEIHMRHAKPFVLLCISDPRLLGPRAKPSEDYRLGMSGWEKQDLASPELSADNWYIADIQRRNQEALEVLQYMTGQTFSPFQIDEAIKLCSARLEELCPELLDLRSAEYAEIVLEVDAWKQQNIGPKGWWRRLMRNYEILGQSMRLAKAQQKWRKVMPTDPLIASLPKPVGKTEHVPTTGADQLYGLASEIGKTLRGHGFPYG